MRWSVQRYGTWEWLDYEMPLVVPEGPEWALSAYGIVRATVPAPAARYLADDGRAMFEDWGTLVHLEIDDPGRVRREWTGWVKEAVLDSSGWDLSLVEFPGYFAGVPYEGLVRGTGTDPAVMIRQIVGDTQGWANSWFGCTVVGSTPVRLGTTLDDKVAAARAVVDARKKTLDSFSKTRTEQTKSLQDLDATLSDEVVAARSLLAQAQAQVASLIKAGAPSAQIETARQTVTARQATYTTALSAYNAEVAAGRAALAAAKTDQDAARVAHKAAEDAYKAAKDERALKGGAYEVRGEDLTDTYRAINELARSAGIEWTTETVYTEGAPDVRVRIHYPRAGGRRDDLIFDTGVNIVSALELEPGGEYANAAVGVGAGEGPKAIRRSLNLRSQRARRPAVVEDKTLRTAAQVDAAMRYEVALRQAPPYPPEIEVIDHPNCRLGAWSVGDLITVQGALRNGLTYRGLLRVVSWARKGATRAVLRLQPAEPI